MTDREPSAILTDEHPTQPLGQGGMMDEVSYLIGDYYPENVKQDGLLQYTHAVPAFHIGQSYENTAAMPISCKLCGGSTFHVAQGSYFTAIRCISCMWECGIHEG